MNKLFIGREKEQQQLKEYLNSEQSEFIDRADRTINICEMKFWNRPYTMTAKDEDDIERKVSTFIETTNTDKNVIVTMITTKGIARNEHSDCIQRELTLDDLFC